MNNRKRSTMNLTAETLGAALGRVAARVEHLNRQRASLLRELTAITTAAEALLSSLGSTRGNGTGKRGRPKGYKMSDETRAKLRAAWRRRKKDLAVVHEQTKPTDERASIRAKAPRRN